MDVALRACFKVFLFLFSLFSWSLTNEGFGRVTKDDWVHRPKVDYFSSLRNLRFGFGTKKTLDKSAKALKTN